MHTFNKNNITHRTCYDFVRGSSRSGKCVFKLQIKGKGWKQVAKGNVVHYSNVIRILKNNDFETHEEAKKLLYEKKFFN